MYTEVSEQQKNSNAHSSCAIRKSEELSSDHDEENNEICDKRDSYTSLSNKKGHETRETHLLSSKRSISPSERLSDYDKNTKRRSSRERSSKRRERPPSPASDSDDHRFNGRSRTTLYVSNIAAEVTEEDLKQLFRKFEPVEDCKIISNPFSKESRGFGFVSFSTDKICEDALRELRGAILCGRRIYIERAKRNRPHDPTPGHYHGPPEMSLKYGYRRRGRPVFPYSEKSAPPYMISKENYRVGSYRRPSPRYRDSSPSRNDFKDNDGLHTSVSYRPGNINRDRHRRGSPCSRPLPSPPYLPPESRRRRVSPRGRQPEYSPIPPYSRNPPVSLSMRRKYRDASPNDDHSAKKSSQRRLCSQDARYGISPPRRQIYSENSNYSKNSENAKGRKARSRSSSGEAGHYGRDVYVKQSSNDQNYFPHDGRHISGSIKGRHSSSINKYELGIDEGSMYTSRHKTDYNDRAVYGGSSMYGCSSTIDRRSHCEISSRYEQRERDDSNLRSRDAAHYHQNYDACNSDNLIRKKVIRKSSVERNNTLYRGRDHEMANDGVSGVQYYSPNNERFSQSDEYCKTSRRNWSRSPRRER